LRIWGDYNNLAYHMGYYDKTTSSHEESLLKMNQIVFDIAKIKQNDLVLDAGCGVGGSVIWLAKSKGSKVIGISLVGNEIELAKKFSQENNVDNLTNFKVMDMTNTDFDNRSFDVIITIESLCYVINKSNFVREAFRILQHDGRVIVTDYFSKDEVSKEEHYYIQQINKSSFIDICSQNEFQNILKENGFRNIQLHNLSYNVKKSYESGIDKLSQLLTKTNDPFLKKIIKEERNRNILENFCMTNQILNYGLIYAEK
jgi:cyclopropane fatty-acyl-phospholipid synthase-like methyltransferase